MTLFSQMPPIAMNNSTTPSKSFERLIDGRSTPDFEYFSQMLPPELARQIMMGKCRNPHPIPTK
jgi:hypothetical protein